MNPMDDFTSNGSRSHKPYTVSDTFFDDIEKSIITRTESIRPRRKGIRIKKWAVTAAASAAIALITAAYALLTTPPATYDFDDVAQAFDNLSDDDQSYMIDHYQQDIFLLFDQTN